MTPEEAAAWNAAEAAAELAAEAAAEEAHEVGYLRAIIDDARDLHRAEPGKPCPECRVAWPCRTEQILSAADGVR